MTVTINGSGTISGVTTMDTTVVNQVFTTPKATTTIGVGNATPSASGAGISFPATQSASTDANTLDDYEEGTWTPVVSRTTTEPTVSYNFRNGNYVKVGRMVTLYCSLQINTVSAAGSGINRITGLPFTYALGSFQSAGSISYNDAVTTTAVNSCQIQGSNIYFNSTGSTRTSSEVNTGWSNSGYLSFSISYMADA